jgi:hypothetical protein
VGDTASSSAAKANAAFKRILERAILPNSEKVLEGTRKVLAF